VTVENDTGSQETTEGTELEPELSAMAQIHRAMASLDGHTRARVYDWVGKKWGLDPIGAPKQRPTMHAPEPARGDSDEEKGSEGQRFEHFADLCSAASPESDADRALVAGYWFQVMKGEGTFGSRECNDCLKDYGAPIGNVTRAFDQLKEKRLAVQVEKSGSTKQARKRYKLTHLGIQDVRRMLGEHG
jgi:hypothetical protein